VAGNVHRKQQNRWAAEDAARNAQVLAASAQAAPVQAPVAPAAAPVAPPTTDAEQAIEQLRQLGELHSAGILTDAEFELQKQRILARM